MVIPAQRLSDLESAAWQTEKRLDRIETHLVDLQDKVDTLQQTANQHAIALSATMKDLRDLRIDVSQMAKVLDHHTETLDRHTETLDRHTETLDRHTETLDRHTEILEGHTVILDGYGATLDTHTAMLGAIVRHFGIEVAHAPAELAHS